MIFLFKKNITPFILITKNVGYLSIDSPIRHQQPSKQDMYKPTIEIPIR
jgi:hypothetical protein